MRAGGRTGDAMRPAHLDDAPQPLGVRLARDAEHPLAAREEDGQAEQRLIDIVLVDARLVKPDGGVACFARQRPAVAALLRGPLCECLELLARRCLLVAPRVAEEGVDLSRLRRLRLLREVLRARRRRHFTRCRAGALETRVGEICRLEAGDADAAEEGRCSLEYRTSVGAVAHERGDGGRLLLLVAALAERAEPADEAAAHGGGRVEGEEEERRREGDRARIGNPEHD